MIRRHLRSFGKYVSIMVLIMGAIIALSERSIACEIDMEVIKNKKDNYKIEDVLIAKATISLTHRNCHNSIQNTEFEVQGLKILGATKWKQLSSRTWERKFKIEVIGDKDGELEFKTIRKCNKGGGTEDLNLKSEPVKSKSE